MFLGLLIGLALWGLLTAIGNWDAAGRDGQKMRIIALLGFLLGTCGAVGWIVEVYL